ncbi:MAG: YeeE/YedE family protein [Gammaproteobacteria bacterium]|nr:MAG: YeeE/YedE family protein [Gammaproteobacteria bacterium]RLA54012.1 MAG: YeeE/YedE family protein [Gammaproteobacteria bacterium]
MHPFIYATIGGALLGIAAVMMMGLKGRIAGVSGILTGTLTESGSERLWRVLFIVGIVIGGAIPALLSTDFRPPAPEAGTLLIIVGGLLVGLGTGLGSGCTTGHGICGIARLSPRSVVATCIFMGAAFLSVYLLRHILGV